MIKYIYTIVTSFVSNNSSYNINNSNFDDSNFDDSKFDDSKFDDSNFDDSKFDICNRVDNDKINNNYVEFSESNTVIKLYYDWMLYKAITMCCLQETKLFNEYEQDIKLYILYIINIYKHINYKIPFDTFYIGLELIGLIMFAKSLINNNQIDWVKEYLWTSNTNKYSGGLIKCILDIISNNLNNLNNLNNSNITDTDTDFYLYLITIKKALILGYKFAQRIDDLKSSYKYYNKLKQLNKLLYQYQYQYNTYCKKLNSRLKDGIIIISLNEDYDNIIEDYDNIFYTTHDEINNIFNYYNDLSYIKYPPNEMHSKNNISIIMHGNLAKIYNNKPDFFLLQSNDILPKLKYYSEFNNFKMNNQYFNNLGI